MGRRRKAPKSHGKWGSSGRAAGGARLRWLCNAGPLGIYGGEDTIESLAGFPDASHVDQNIGVHYGELTWGSIGFAILEDRKWKSAPKTLLPGAAIRNGWPQNRDWNSAKQGDVPGAQLLGERQEKFLEKWARDWPDTVQMKAVVSATIFCNLATLPKEMMSDAGTPKLPIQLTGGYAENEKLTQDHDSNGWPQTPRNRALRAMRSCLAVHIAGDQHLASTVQYGIDDFNDGPYGICSPAISNIFPRRCIRPALARMQRQRLPEIPVSIWTVLEII